MRIAILLPSLEDSQLTRSVVSQGNRIVASSASVDISVFYETLAPSPVVPNFATSQMLDCYGFTGVAVATTLSTAEKLLGMTGRPCGLFTFSTLNGLGIRERSATTMMSTGIKNCNCFAVRRVTRT